MTFRIVPERFVDFTQNYSEAQLALKAMEYKLEWLEIRMEKSKKGIADFFDLRNELSRELKELANSGV